MRHACPPPLSLYPSRLYCTVSPLGCGGFADIPLASAAEHAPVERALWISPSIMFCICPLIRPSCASPDVAASCLFTASRTTGNRSSNTSQLPPPDMWRVRPGCTISARCGVPGWTAYCRTAALHTFFSPTSSCHTVTVALLQRGSSPHCTARCCCGRGVWTVSQTNRSCRRSKTSSPRQMAARSMGRVVSVSDRSVCTLPISLYYIYHTILCHQTFSWPPNFLITNPIRCGPGHTPKNTGQQHDTLLTVINVIKALKA